MEEAEDEWDRVCMVAVAMGDLQVFSDIPQAWQAYLTTAHHTLATALATSDLPPLRYEQVGITVQVAQELLGQKIWRGFYECAELKVLRMVTEHCIVPRKLLEALKAAIQQLAALHSQQFIGNDAAAAKAAAEERVAEAQKEYEEMEAARDKKKRKQ